MNKIDYKKIMCAVFGHPRVIEISFGYETCARCDEQLGDSLGGVGIGKEWVVIKGHKCKTCKRNYKNLKWHEKIMIGNVWER